MFQVLCQKQGQYYIPKSDVHDPEYLVYGQTIDILRAAKDFKCNGARVVIEFEDDPEHGQKKVKYNLYNFTPEFSHEFEKQRRSHKI